MKVYKFGGASIKSADAIKNMAGIIQATQNNKLLVVVSAMGKTTNALELLLKLKRTEKAYHETLNEIKQYHKEILSQLFKPENKIFPKVDQLFDELEKHLNEEYAYNVHYDQVVSFGEIISSTIIQAYLKQELCSAIWLDARKYIQTDNTFREGKVNWDRTSDNIKKEIPGILEDHVIITQGFIGGYQNLTTTLGREGSDFSAAIFASGLQAESVTIWKDVPGILNADPNRFANATLFDALSYTEAAEMSYYGATVIHPKTIKPLANRNIPLLVRSFDNPSAKGTVIHTTCMNPLPPAVIVKEHQSLILLTVRDLTFINEENLKMIFHQLALLNIKISMMQNSAITFSVCIDHDENKIQQLIEHLQEHFSISIKHDLYLITIKNYNQEALEQYKPEGVIALEQKTILNYQALIWKE
jgi:aspartate kinase